MTYYSQHGEDVILDAMLKNQEIGFFVEVGCVDGRRFSNTLYFEEKGWRGVCVEAHAGYIDLIKKNRPNSQICHCAAGEADEDAVFYANDRGSLSTLDKTKEHNWKKNYKKYFSGFKEQKVNKVRLSSLFDRLGVSDIDILSLDIEGYEIEALKGLDLSKHRPRILVIESDSIFHEAKLDYILLKSGYSKVVRFCGNVFYVLSDFKLKNMSGVVLHGTITHTEHPMDNYGEVCLPVELKVETVKVYSIRSAIIYCLILMIRAGLIGL